ncbi:MAG: ABC transporter substrate-binding protein [Clostridiales bacterium]|jgi:branched-chain amino acid transport system substrate-binding protein|nr:ABC transporter substrate-binding protein [Clostridiales bacterium]
MKKRIFSLLMVFSILMLSLAACGTKEEKPNDSKNNQKEETNDNDQKEETNDNDQKEVTQTGKFYIGGIGPITGGAAVYGQHVMNAAQIAVDEINAAGGINGALIEYRFEDDVHDPEKAVNAYNTLKDWGMQILMGTVTSNPGNAVKEETYADNMFMLTPSGSAPDVIQYDNAFQVCFSDPNQGIASAVYIADKGLATKVAAIYNSSDVYSTGIYEKFAEEAKNQNFEIVSAEAFTDDSKSDFNVQLQKAKDNGAELVFLPIYYEEATLILTQAAAMDYKPLFFGCDGLDGILGVENFDTSLAEGVMLLTPFAADAADEKTQKFVADYKAAHNDTIPNQFAADAYDAIYIIKAAIEESGVTPDMSTSDICDGLKDAMTKIKVDGLTGAGMTWSATGEVNKAPMAVVIKDGQYVSAD